MHVQAQWLFAALWLWSLAHVARNRIPVRLPKPENFISREAWGSQPGAMPASRKHIPTWITLHHVGEWWKAGDDPVPYLHRLQRWAKSRHWPDLPYHFLIAPDGRIFEGRSINYEPESNTAYDLAGHVGIALLGNFDRQPVPAEQWKASVALTARMMRQHGIPLSHVRSHRDVVATGCPGRDFYRYFQNGQFHAGVTAASNEYQK